MTSTAHRRARLRGDHRPGRLLTYGRYRLAPGQIVEPHDHDYHECFWVEGGAGVHLVAERETPIAVGDCVFVRARDLHQIRNAGPQELSWTNVCFPRELLDGYRERYAGELGWWPWREEGETVIARYGPDAIDALRAAVHTIPLEHQRRLDIDWFVGLLLHHLQPPRGVPHASRPPAWLEEAIGAFHAPEHLQEGLPALVALCGRCPEHVNRTVRRHYRTTARDLVRQLRLERAARQLRLTREPILDIALEAGFENLSCFYRHFKRRYGCPPRRFRLSRG